MGTLPSVWWRVRSVIQSSSKFLRSSMTIFFGGNTRPDDSDVQINLRCIKLCQALRHGNLWNIYIYTWISGELQWYTVYVMMMMQKNLNGERRCVSTRSCFASQAWKHGNFKILKSILIMVKVWVFFDSFISFCRFSVFLYYTYLKGFREMGHYWISQVSRFRLFIGISSSETHRYWITDDLRKSLIFRLHLV